jgi:hypothetical protein
MYRHQKGNSFGIVVVTAVIVLLFAQFVLGVDVWSAAKMKIADGVQIVSQKGYQICENIRFEQIKAAGVKFTQQSWDGFLQICDRLVLSIGHLTVYADLEARVMFVYSDPTQQQQAYYVTF